MTIQEALIADVDYGPAHNSLGWIYFEEGNLYLAAWEFEFAAKLMPDNAEPINNLGLVLERAGRLEEALAQFQMAAEMDPSEYEYNSNLVRSKLQLGQRDDETAHLLRKVVFLDPRPEWRDWADEQIAIDHADIVLYLNELPMPEPSENGPSLPGHEEELINAP